MKQIILILLAHLCMMSCATSNAVQVNDAGIAKTTDTPELTIFLLERDIPQTINRLGTVSIPMKVNTLNLKQFDVNIKAKLRELCKEAGANGAYRINEGNYQTYVVSYLIFQYNK